MGQVADLTHYMRSVAAFGIACALFAFAAAGKASTPPASLTIVFKFDGSYSEKSVREMKRELDSIMKDSGLQVEWRDRNDVASSDSFSNLVVVKFRGKCRMEPIPYLYDERGPLAYTYSSEGSVLPFSEIGCDEIRSVVRGAMWGGDYSRSDLLFGRALARVLAHELYHVLAGTPSHADKGVAQRALSGSQLISDKLRLGEAELRRLRPAPSPIGR